MESALKPSALAQPFDIGDAIGSWFGLFNLFLEANQIVIAELFLILQNRENYLDVIFRLLHHRVHRFCLLVEN